MATYSERMILTQVEQLANLHDIFLSPQNLSCSKCTTIVVNAIWLIKFEFTQPCDTNALNFCQ